MPPARTFYVASHPCQAYRKTSYNGWASGLRSMDRLKFRQLESDGANGEYYKKRFEKNQGKLFTFLDYDGIPWNNNNAEHAIKAFASLRKVIGGVSTEKGIREYLTLLSICETCQYKGVSFLDFLRSGEKDIDVFMKRGLRGSKEAGFT